MKYVLQLKELVLKYVDILVDIETKIDDTFLNSNSRVESFFDLFRLDRIVMVGGL